MATPKAQERATGRKTWRDPVVLSTTQAVRVLACENPENGREDNGYGVGVQDEAPRVETQVADDMLDVHHFGDDCDEVSHRPRVGSKAELSVRYNVSDGAQEDEREGEERMQARDWLFPEDGVGDSHKKRCGRAENDEALDVCHL